MLNSPDYLLFAQHGWADTSVTMRTLANRLRLENTVVITPNLGFYRTWWRMRPLIAQVSAIAQYYLNHFPHTPIRIIGHSMGGLIWLEILKNHPEWWQRVESLVLIACPIKGAELARIIDPLGLGIGVAKALAKNRQSLAENIAKIIPTLSISSNYFLRTDGTISVNSTQFNYAQCICIPGVSHADLRISPKVIYSIRDFWGIKQKIS
ncbi:alpha/beta hydrolase [Euhalothece natronophila Z-M001]|uniref:Alpha/beta hydrolase n=2 Tax=Euhalothece TaxID=65097 RepID=A0A5B8NSI8_9CHRO|nr:alpha/beta hydrolase [Euhalothece natronophila Z-M001]